MLLLSLAVHAEEVITLRNYSWLLTHLEIISRRAVQETILLCSASDYTSSHSGDTPSPYTLHTCI